jgi:hypothetical protein
MWSSSSSHTILVASATPSSDGGTPPLRLAITLYLPRGMKLDWYVTGEYGPVHLGTCTNHAARCDPSIVLICDNSTARLLILCQPRSYDDWMCGEQHRICHADENASDGKKKKKSRDHIETRDDGHRP